jgi:hypothetical protein
MVLTLRKQMLYLLLVPIVREAIEISIKEVSTEKIGTDSGMWDQLPIKFPSASTDIELTCDCLPVTTLTIYRQIPIPDANTQ